jgi:hypothetical protein
MVGNPTMAEVEQKKQKADSLENLAERLRDAESIAEDVPVLSELFHEVRTSNRRARDGRHVALFDYDSESDSWECRSVKFLESGTHYRDTGADLSLSHKPFAFLSVKHFSQYMANSIDRSVRDIRQNASQLEQHIETQKRREEIER